MCSNDGFRGDIPLRLMTSCPSHGTITFLTSPSLLFPSSCFLIIHSERPNKGKGKGSPYNRPRRPRGWVEVWPYPFLTSALRGGGWSRPVPGCFPSGNSRYPFWNVQLTSRWMSFLVREFKMLPTRKFLETWSLHHLFSS